MQNILRLLNIKRYIQRIDNNICQESSFLQLFQNNYKNLISNLIFCKIYFSHIVAILFLCMIKDS